MHRILLMCAASFDFSRSGAVIGRHAASSGRYFAKEACRIQHAKFHGGCHVLSWRVTVFMKSYFYCDRFKGKEICLMMILFRASRNVSCHATTRAQFNAVRLNWARSLWSCIWGSNELLALIRLCLFVLQARRRRPHTRRGSVLQSLC